MTDAKVKQELKDNPDQIASYLTQALETDDLTAILAAFRDVLRAQNVMAFSRATGLRRDRLYKTFGGTIDPDFSRVLALLEGLGVRLVVQRRRPLRPTPPLPKLGRPTKTVRKDHEA
jgi:probable addiction module antidote protein